MEIFIFLIISHILIDKTRCMQIRPIGLEILPESKTNGQNILLRRAEETLNLTCRVVAESLEDVHDLPRYKLTWHFPQHNSQNRVVEEELHNARVLTIENLKETDAGDYACRAELATPYEKLLLNETVRVHVKKRCGEQMFTCPAGVCIARRYVCDGKADCKDGADEHQQNCGLHACEGKIMCAEEGRCIPKNWCCDQHTQPNCTAKTKLPCCTPNNKRYSIPDFTDMSEQQRFSDMGFLQTTIYTVIGCAMAFMFIVTILVIAICRVHMKRSLLSRCPNSRTGRAAHRGRATQPLYDLDVFLNRSSFPSEAHSGLLVTYNINNGIQFVGRPVDPPPYCEVVASPPREGPPPPYASHENLAASAGSRDSPKAVTPCPDLPGPGPGPGLGPGQTREPALTSGEVEPLLGGREGPGNTVTITTVVSTMPRSKDTRRAANRASRPMPLVKSASLSPTEETGSGPTPGRLRESFIGLRREREREAPERSGEIGRGQGSSKE